MDLIQIHFLSRAPFSIVSLTLSVLQYHAEIVTFLFLISAYLFIV